MSKQRSTLYTTSYYQVSAPVLRTSSPESTVPVLSWRLKQGSSTIIMIVLQWTNLTRCGLSLPILRPVVLLRRAGDDTVQAPVVVVEGGRHPRSTIRESQQSRSLRAVSTACVHRQRPKIMEPATKVAKVAEGSGALQTSHRDAAPPLPRVCVLVSPTYNADMDDIDPQIRQHLTGKVEVGRPLDCFPPPPPHPFIRYPHQT